MFIDISAVLGKKGEQIEFSITENIEKDEDYALITEFGGPVVIKGKATNVDGAIKVEADGEIEVFMSCDRCVKDVKEDIDFILDEVFVASGNAQEGDETYSGSVIDLTGAVKKSILSSLPMKVLCSEDCKGLCPQCGKDLNTGECGCKTEHIDPRFESLRSLFKVDEEV